jgi:hypothetical protein
MGIFSKLNFKAVHEAYCDVTALNLITEFMCLLVSGKGLILSKVDIAGLVDEAAFINAESIARITGGSGMDFNAGMSRISQVSRSIKRDMMSKSGGAEGDLDMVIDFCKTATSNLSERLFFNIHKGYLSISATDAITLLEKNEERIKHAVNTNFGE